MTRRKGGSAVTEGYDSEFDYWYTEYTRKLPPGSIVDHLHAAWLAGYTERERKALEADGG